MSESVRALIIIILAFILMWALGTLFMRLTFKRTFKDLLRMLRNAQAFTSETAKFIDELDNKGESLIKFRFLRDYSPQILQMLLEEKIVQVTHEGKIYLSERTLAEHKLSSLDK